MTPKTVMTVRPLPLAALVLVGGLLLRAGYHKATLTYPAACYAVFMMVFFEPTLDALRPLVPVFLSYVLSFVYLGIYWNNHHHLFQAATTITGGALWANLNLLFWLSLLPFATAWLTCLQADNARPGHHFVVDFFVGEFQVSNRKKAMVTGGGTGVAPAYRAAPGA